MNGERDRAIDTVRAVAIAGVVLGHWLVTGLVLGPGGGLDQASPLRALPSFAPVTWVLQTLGLFFFAGGYAAARSRRPCPAAWRASPYRWPASVRCGHSCCWSPRRPAYPASRSTRWARSSSVHCGSCCRSSRCCR
nr:hypothetical protein [Phytohabitans suffuscus]